MDKSQSDKSRYVGHVWFPGESAPRYTVPVNSRGQILAREEAPFPIEAIQRGFGRNRPRALRYSGAWAPRSRTTPGALRTTMRRTSGRIGHVTRCWSQRPGRIVSGDFSPRPK